MPSVLDRVTQQSLLQILQPMIATTFSGAHSHGFRPGRNGHHAVGEAQRYIQDRKRGVVDVEHCFDRVNHDVLMRRRSTSRIRGCWGLSVVIPGSRHHGKG